MCGLEARSNRAPGQLGMTRAMNWVPLHRQTEQEIRFYRLRDTRNFRVFFVFVF